MREALRSLAEILNAVATHYLDNTTFFESGSDAGGAEGLLYIVDEGLKAMQLRRERLKAGTAVSEDWTPR